MENCNEVAAHINEVIGYFNEVRAHNDEVIRGVLMLKLISHTHMHTHTYINLLPVTQ